MSASVMDARLVLLAALLSTHSDSRETSDDRVPKIYASAGAPVVLPCEINGTVRDNPTVEWSKDGLGQKNITFLYRDGREDFVEKNEDFQNRTSVFMNKTQNRSVSLRISNVRPSDAGKHECSIIRDKKREVIKTLKLIVCAAPEPKLSVVDVGTLQCEVNSRHSHLNMTFLDHQGKEIYAEEQDPDSSGCFPFRVRVKVPTATDRITCRVHQPQTNQFRDAQIYFTAKDKKSCPVWPYFAGAVAGAVCTVGIGFVLLSGFRNKIRSYFARRKTPPESNQPPVQSTDNQDEYSSLLLNQTDSELSRKFEELELQSQEKDRIISKQREELKHIRSTQSPVAHQPDQPAFDVPTVLDCPNSNNPKPGASSNNNYSNSDSLSQEKDIEPGVRKQTASPDRPRERRRCISLTHYHGPVSSDPSQDSFSENEPLRRSKSLSERLNVNGAKFQSSAGTQNRYSVLADLPEDAT
ncbi:uncharacterized protein LOC133950310 [Platichthys flesus]|uniref:uncharacterized protein LOC133950310 n=1 Tax=Platichthys flesus TaxID=8260 RepID=UPI002DB73B4F|nr:uncharacterized protein LOC133950310 [Platichthys flesus]